MAVLQISRIQLRRGKKNEASGLPQLASGEMAWAIDAQELYIGSGSVNEGAPAVDNIRILTENDNILDLAEQYQYKNGISGFQTGVGGANFPVVRTLQDRLDDFVTSSNYGIVSDETDQTASIQNAITNLFVTTNSRVILQFLPGVYEISDTIDIPSYVTIEGAGVGKTVFNFTGTGTVFNFIKDAGSPSTILESSQPRFISMKGFSVETDNIATQVFNLSSVRDSIFEDIEINGVWTNISATSSTSIGIGMYAFSSMVTCQRNKFTRVTVNGFCTGVHAKEDIFNNLFDACNFNQLETGFKFGVDANLSSIGQQYGPRKNVIKNSRFERINQHAIIVDNGYGNRSRSNTFIDVGNDSSGAVPYNSGQLQYSIIKFTNSGNSSTQDIFDRAIELASTGFGVNSYLAEVQGAVYFSSPETRVIDIGQASSAIAAFRIPLNSTTGITISYVYQSTAFEQMRKGTLSIALDRINNNIQLVDDYDYAGTTGDDENLVFSAEVEDVGGYNTIVISYTNSNISDTATLTYSYTALS
jgi:hypothetical protein